MKYSLREDTPRLDKYRMEKIYGGIWIDNVEEFAKFASAVNNYGFEENGEGITYTDNYFYAYYRNIDGQPIPYASVYLNEEDSQDIVNQINQEVKDGRKKEGVKEYINRATLRARSSQSKNHVDNGNNSISSIGRGYDRLDSNIFRKGKYYDNPSLYVKTERVDEVAEQADTKYSLRVGGVLHPQGDDYDGTRKKYNDKVKSFGYKMREG